MTSGQNHDLQSMWPSNHITRFNSTSTWTLWASRIWWLSDACWHSIQHRVWGGGFSDSGCWLNLIHWHHHRSWIHHQHRLWIAPGRLSAVSGEPWPYLWSLYLLNRSRACWPDGAGYSGKDSSRWWWCCAAPQTTSRPDSFGCQLWICMERKQRITGRNVIKLWEINSRNK